MIEGKLVRLRAPEMADLERNVRWVNDAEVIEHLSLRYRMSFTAEEAWMREHSSRMLSYEHAVFAIETTDGLHIGNTNFFDVHAEDRKAKLGIMIGDKEYWSRGYGTDAVNTLLRFGFDEMNLHRVELDVFEGNLRGQACYRKCGFTEEGRRRQAHYGAGRYHDVIVMAILSDEFYSLHGRMIE